MTKKLRSERNKKQKQDKKGMLELKGTKKKKKVLALPAAHYSEDGSPNQVERERRRYIASL